ncbi:MAG TPA: restriction endonuclease subunit S [Candidatus Paceibacterota bacterium]|nr:restriction endonuclease subunit S [Candidatus Paceibacterota bacterium]
MQNNTVQQNIPSGWNIRPLNKVIVENNKSTIKVGDADNNGDYPFFTSGEKILTHSKALVSGKNIYMATGGVANLKFFDGDASYSTDTYCFNSKEDTKYIYYTLLNNLRNINKQLFSGSGLKHLQKNDFKKEEILLPPIKEQQKIAEILGMVDEDIAKTQEVIEATEKLKRGLMQNIVSSGNKDGVKHLAFGNIGKVSMCKRIFKEETSSDGDIPFYKIGTFGGEPDSFISQEIYDKYRSKFSFPKIGDILLSASGTIGRKVVYDGKPAYFQDSNIIWLEHDESKILNNFLFHLYDTIKWQTEGSTIKRLYNDIFLRKVIPIPPINMQKRIVEVLSAVDEKISINKKLKEKLTLLKKGLMQDLLSGKKRV